MSGAARESSKLQPRLRRRVAGMAAAPDQLLGTSPLAMTLREQVARAASVDSTVTITGETGTGKNLVARQVHRLSKRSQRRFVHVDCSALSPGLVESELYGHERGAFTGAIVRRIGRFELAGDGTILLDEIGELEPALQSKLLRVLEEREFESVGGVDVKPMRARVLAATSRDLEAEVERGLFRADLYFRLNILRIRVPALRERLSDLPQLANHAAGRIAHRMGWRAAPLPADFVDALRGYHWPGNVRQLSNLVEAALVRSPDGAPTAQTAAELLQGALRRQPLAHANAACRVDLPDPSEAPPGGDRSERQILARMLVESGGNVARVARRLGLPRSTLRYRILRLGLDDLVPRT